ncbi:hypothetical protein [Acuticoccus sp.]|uniref:hypothetical protein n=1 Tax=Acuticoccus sp. TaxID=1904378 RepID=UPI003B528687
MSEVQRSLAAAWLLFLGRRDGLDLLDRSVAGYWRSFGVILLVLPIDAVSLVALSRIGATEPFGQAFAQRLPVLALDWVAFPVALAAIAGPLGISHRYVTYVVARNWAAPLGWTLLTVPLVLQGAGFLGETAATLAAVVALGVVVRYHYVIVRLALGVDVAIAGALVVADVLLSLLLLAAFG